mgnify:CR=1 FL=1
MAENSSKKFKFISPGVFVDEIDNSQLPASPTEIGPLIIGRSRKGPANKPVSVSSYSDFVQTFGNPVAGNEGGDVWRDGDRNAPTYAAFAAKAWLASNAPLTFMRVLGDQASNAETAGAAGWTLDATAGTPLAQGGSYALVVWPSGTTGTQLTGAVAAQFYCEDSRVVLSGTEAAEFAPTSARGSTVYQLGTDLNNIKLRFTGSSMAHEETVSLNSNQPNFIRRVLNTDPSITNSSITSTSTQTYYQGGKYFLGETFENRFGAVATGSSLGLLGAGSSYLGAIVPMVTKTAAATFAQDQADFQGAARKSSTGWFFSQDLGNNPAAYNAKNMQKIFRIEAITAGENFQREVKISISNITAGRGDFQPYGSFSLLVRDLRDTDNNQIILERYDNLNLNPASPQYIAAMIGDKYQEYDKTINRNVDYGEYSNASNYIRVVMNDDIASGIGETRLLPFGVFGPPKYRDVAFSSGSVAWRSAYSSKALLPSVGTGQTFVRTQIAGGGDGEFGLDGHAGTGDNNILLDVAAVNNAFSVLFPSVPLRITSEQASPRSLNSTFWGAWTGRAFSNADFDLGFVDYVRPRNYDYSDGTQYNAALDISGYPTAKTGSEGNVISWAFSLDDVRGKLTAGALSGSATYEYGFRAASNSISAEHSYTGTLAAGIDRFTTVLAGGSDGYNKQEREPFNNTSALSGKTETNSYALFSLRKAINIATDPETVQMNAASIPGVWAPEVTNYLVETAQDRGDTLAIIDLQYTYTPSAETNASPATANAGNTPSAAVSALLSRNINNSYAAAYYPWVRIYDSNTNQTLWAPPSIAALGVLSNTDRVQAPWFAPAGFTRGGLSEGAAGIPVLDVSRRLTSDDRDSLYDANINPIAKFPAEGIVIFGQKTLQQTASALDRINVRRLMIYLKREVSFIASRLLFGPNTSATWDRFKGQATPLLDAVQSQYGIESFRLILDETTTTPDLIDRNIIYAKLLVKPTRAVEFFAIDFVVTNSGASFED